MIEALFWFVIHHGNAERVRKFFDEPKFRQAGQNVRQMLSVGMQRLVENIARKHVLHSVGMLPKGKRGCIPTGCKPNGIPTG